MRVLLRKRGDGSWSQGVEFSLIDVFGQKLPYKATLNIRRILQVLLREGMNVSSADIGKRLELSARYVREIRQRWAEDIRKLINDAIYLGYTANDLAVYLEFGGGQEFADRLHALSNERGEEPASLLPTQFQDAVDALWFEYRETKAYQGYPADAWSTHPPRWFLEKELGLSALDQMVLIRTVSDYYC